MNDKKIIDIQSLIYEVRSKQVMLDSDLAILYNCFKLTGKEYDTLLKLKEKQMLNNWSQIATSLNNNGRIGDKNEIGL